MNARKTHFKNVNLRIQNYAMQITSSASAFNTFLGDATDNLHLVLNAVKSVNFADKNSKMILDFGSGFKFGERYLLSKLVVDTSGTNKLGVDIFDRLYA